MCATSGRDDHRPPLPYHQMPISAVPAATTAAAAVCTQSANPSPPTSSWSTPLALDRCPIKRRLCDGGGAADRRRSGDGAEWSCFDSSRPPPSCWRPPRVGRPPPPFWSGLYSSSVRLSRTRRHRLRTNARSPILP